MLQLWLTTAKSKILPDKRNCGYREKGDRYAIAKEMADAKKQAGKAAVIFHVKEIYDSSVGAGGKKLPN